jgi:CBS domain-containing protein
MDTIQVRSVMTNLVLTVRPQDLIEEVAKRLLANRVSGAPVVDGGQLVGIVSETDLIHVYASPRRRVSPLPLPGEQPGDTSTIGDVMTTKVVSIKPEATVWEAAALIDRHRVRRLPVVDDDGFVVGIVARADLVRCMAQVQTSLNRLPA